MGYALLSIEDDRFIERVYRRSLARGLCTRDELPLKVLMQRINSCRQTGYSFTRNSFNPIAAIVAAPLPLSFHAQRLSIGIGGPAERIAADVPQIGEMLLAHVRPLAQADPAITLR